jgi:hypothetical protein
MAVRGWQGSQHERWLYIAADDWPAEIDRLCRIWEQPFTGPEGNAFCQTCRKGGRRSGRSRALMSGRSSGIADWRRPGTVDLDETAMGLQDRTTNEYG